MDAVNPMPTTSSDITPPVPTEAMPLPGQTRPKNYKPRQRRSARRDQDVGANGRLSIAQSMLFMLTLEGMKVVGRVVKVGDTPTVRITITGATLCPNCNIMVVPGVCPHCQGVV